MTNKLPVSVTIGYIDEQTLEIILQNGKKIRTKIRKDGDLSKTVTAALKWWYSKKGK
jgi:predicted house-cleaning noncanonical NTP pyrophosphatase (MazG superfamily)